MRWLPVLFLIGCVPPPVYRVQRAARVPRPTVPLRTGQPLAGPLEFTLGASSAMNTKKPEGNGESAIEVPDHQMRGELRIRLFERGELAIIHERAIGHATKLDETQADITSGQPSGSGAALRFSIHPDGAPWSVGLDWEMLRWSVPYTEIRTCIENCENVDTYQENHSETGELTWGFGITPAIRVSDNISLFGGMFLRNHPTIVRKDTEVGSYNDEDLEAGPVNVLLHAGIAARLGAFTALLLVNQDMDRDPVTYGPGIGFALSASLDPFQRGGNDPPSKIEEAKARMRRAEARRAAAR